jgi:hypothetical protein
MTPIVLLEQLRDYVREQVKDIMLPVRSVKNKTTADYAARVAVERAPRPPEVHLMRLPDKDAEENRIPYIVLQVLTGEDKQAVGDLPQSECRVRVVAVVYDEDASAGMMSALNVITRLRVALLRSGQVGQFLLKPRLEWTVYDVELNPCYVGEMMLTFEMQEIEREVNLYG